MLQQARDPLAPVYDGYSEGFADADLQQAKTLLAQLTDGVTKYGWGDVILICSMDGQNRKAGSH
jgi:hypothetical protein